MYRGESSDSGLQVNRCPLCIAREKCLKAISTREGEFARHKYDEPELVSLGNCGDYPGLILPKVTIGYVQLLIVPELCFFPVTICTGTGRKVHPLPNSHEIVAITDRAEAPGHSGTGRQPGRSDQLRQLAHRFQQSRRHYPLPDMVAQDWI